MSRYHLWDSDLAAARYLVKAASVGEPKKVPREQMDIEARALLTGRTVDEVTYEAQRRSNGHKLRRKMIIETLAYLRFLK